MKKSLFILAALAVLVVIALTVLRHKSVSPGPDTGGRLARAIRTTVSPSRPSPSQRPRAAVQRVKPDLDDGEDDDDLPPAEKALKERIEKALDDENLKMALECAEKARACPNAEIRQAMVDTLGWFGKGALPELTPFLADADDDVRESAQNEWSTAVADIDDDGAKIGAVEMAFDVIRDEDFLEDISNEYIGVDEKLAVESLVRIIADSQSKEGVAKAKETYEFVTGDEWQGADEAQRWLAEEYEPPTE